MLLAVRTSAFRECPTWCGGIRRGSDVVKALALGAKAVMVGRVWLWSLAARGEEGVREGLEIIRSGIDETLIGLGHGSILSSTA